MPYISMFFGIIIRMFYNEHNPPHFHAQYQGQRGMFDFDGHMIRGNITSKTAQALIKQWACLHREELIQNWNNMIIRKQFNKIAPLD